MPLAAAGVVDPLLHFRQVRSAHFVIYFHQGEDQLAARLVTFVEDVRNEVGASLDVVPPGLTHVILADQSELANGWATPLPRNTVFLNAAAPSGADYIGRTDDWLRLVFTHEYTHIVHLDRSGSWAWLVRGIFGRTGIAFPNLWLPQWQIEGLATWEESVLTGQGRRSAGDFRAIERVAAQAGRPVTIDRASGGLVGWPDGHAAYAAGLGFHEYLVNRFGQASLGRLARATSRRLPFFGTRAYRSVFGESLGSLWRDYQQQLVAAPGSTASRSPSATRRLTTLGNVVVGPRFAPSDCDGCAGGIVYSARTPDALPSLRVVAADGSSDHELTTRYLGATTGMRGSTVVFDQQEVRRNVAVYSDLYALNRKTGEVRALTREGRLQDPDISPDGRAIAAVRENGGQRDLVVARPGVDLVTVTSIDPSQIHVLVAEADTQFGAPRWSPDGRLLAAERRRPGALPDVVVIDAETGAVTRALADRHARVVTPAWRPDGRAIVAAADFDGGPFDLYEFTLGGEGAARRLTRTEGALWPDISPDARTLVFAGYGVDGYDVYAAEFEPLAGEPTRALSAPSAPRVESPQSGPVPSRTYAPWGTIAPTSWSPYLVADSDQTRFGATVGGSDLLERHAYGVSATWLVDGPQVARPVSRDTPDWSAAYLYGRWRPSLFISASRETLFRTARDAVSANEIAIAASQRELQAGLFIPIVHVRESTQALLSLVRTDARYRLPDRDRVTTLVSSRLALAHDTTRRYGYSISREHGANLGATVEMARRALGSDADATTATVDMRVYLPGIAMHHVLAARVAGGVSNGADLARQTFRLGLVGASSSVIDFGGDALGLMRSGAGTRTGDRLAAANLEYRFPLVQIERGLGTWPLLLRTAHASVFADAGRVTGGERTSNAWARAFGAELSMDAVAGYALPLAASIGVSWSHDGNARRGAAVYARLGRAF